MKQMLKFSVARTPLAQWARGGVPRCPLQVPSARSCTSSSQRKSHARWNIATCRHLSSGSAQNAAANYSNSIKDALLFLLEALGDNTRRSKLHQVVANINNYTFTERQCLKIIASVLEACDEMEIQEPGQNAILQDRVMHFIQHTGVCSNDIAMMITTYYGTTERPGNKLFFLNLLVRYNLYIGRDSDAYSLALNSIQDFRQTQGLQSAGAQALKRHHQHDIGVATTTLEVLVFHLLDRDYVMPAYAILRKARAQHHYFTARIWNLFIQKALSAANMPFGVLYWIWYSCVSQHGMAYPSNGVLLRLAERVVNYGGTRFLLDLNSYFLKKNETSVPEVSVRMLLASVNSTAQRSHKSSWGLLLRKLRFPSVRSAFAGAGYQLKATDFPLTTRALQNVKPEKIPAVFDFVNVDKKSPKTPKKTELYFLMNQDPKLDTLFLNSLVLSVLERKQKCILQRKRGHSPVDIGKFDNPCNEEPRIIEKAVRSRLELVEDIDGSAFLALVRKLAKRTDVQVNEETFRYLFQLALLSPSPTDIVSETFEFWRAANFQTTTTDARQKDNNFNIPISPLVSLKLLEKLRELNLSPDITQTFTENLRQQGYALPE